MYLTRGRNGSRFTLLFVQVTCDYHYCNYCYCSCYFCCFKQFFLIIVGAFGFALNVHQLQYVYLPIFFNLSFAPGGVTLPSKSHFNFNFQVVSGWEPCIHFLEEVIF